MLKEALSYCVGLVKDGVEPEQLDIRGVRDKSLVVHNGKIVEYEHQPEDRKHHCQGIESFGEWCGETDSSIWYSMESIELILNELGLRRDRIHMRLTRSTEWEAAMCGCCNARQQKFIRWILDHLDRNIETAEPGLLQTVRQLKFNMDTSGQSSVANGKESFGKAIEAEVAGGKEFPDDITIRVLVWAELDIHVDVRMAFIVNPHEAEFTLRALPASQQQATRSALEQLGEQLEEHKGEGNLYCGKP